MHFQSLVWASSTLLYITSALRPRRFAHQPTSHPFRALTNTSSITCTPLYTFTANTWLENLSLRSNGDILTTVSTTPELYLLPSTLNNDTASKLLYTFPNATTVSGLTRSPIEPDTFYTTTGSFNFTSFSTDAGTYSVWRVILPDPTTRDVMVEKVADLPTLAVVNGITSMPNSSTILLADAYMGIIYKFDPVSSTLSTLLDDPTLKAPNTTSIRIGVNGLKISHGYLYFSNSHQLLLARVPLSSQGTVIGPVQIIHNATTADDFILSSDGLMVYVAEDEANAISSIDMSRMSANASGVVYDVLVGGGNSTEIMGPTALQWGVGEQASSLFYTSNGGIAQYVLGDAVLGGSVGRIDGVGM